VEQRKSIYKTLVTDMLQRQKSLLDDCPNDIAVFSD
jgi:hypothetical protein